MSQTPVDYQALAAFRLALRRYLAVAVSAARKVGLTPQHYQALLAIKGAAGAEPLAVGGLADALLLKPHSALELSSRLEQAGLVRRAVSPQDRRKIILSLTPKAEAVLAELSAVHLEELSRVGPELARTLNRLVRQTPERRGLQPGA